MKIKLERKNKEKGGYTIPDIAVIPPPRMDGGFIPPLFGGINTVRYGEEQDADDL